MDLSIRINFTEEDLDKLMESKGKLVDQRNCRPAIVLSRNQDNKSPSCCVTMQYVGEPPTMFHASKQELYEHFLSEETKRVIGRVLYKDR